MKKNSKILFFVVFFCALFLNINCKKEPCPTCPPNGALIQLTIEDVSCTEAWLRLSVANINIAIVVLKRDNAAIDTLFLTTTDTTIADVNLLPSHVYTYTAQLLNYSTTLYSTTQTRTMDTTSHNFTFQTYILGDGSGSSCLYDVAIINDTLAYAVGEIWQGGTRYNLANWDGQKWQLQQIQFYTICGQQNRTAYRASSVFVFSENDIWISVDGSQVARWNGSTQTATMCMPVSFSIKKLWGESPTSVYAVGDGGNIVHYNGSWTKIESGTLLDIRDIWGDYNRKKNEYEILATAGNPLISAERKIIQIVGTTTIKIADAGINWAINSIWFSAERYYWVVGSGVWEKHTKLSMLSWRSKSITTYTLDAVRGNDINDVIMCGAYGEVLHFNGLSWKSYFSQTGIIGAYLSLAVKNNMVLAVGEKSPQAIILMGRRLYSRSQTPFGNSNGLKLCFE